jgi:archaellum biogenesis ATPase FlaH
MSNINEQIVSIRSAIGGSYQKPDPSLVETFQKELQDNEVALNYLRNERGLTDETIKEFKLGYNAKRNAIAIPIFKYDELINVKFRHLNADEHDGVKYGSLRGAETWIYNEKAFSLGKQKGKILVVEGEFDCMSAWQRGIRNVVSSSSGAGSTGLWIELFDTVPQVYIAYDNDDAGKKGAKKLSEKIGADKCLEVKYPDDVKDTNEFFLKHTIDEFRELIKTAQPFYNYDFVNVSSILDSLRNGETNTISSEFIPGVKIGKDWLMVLSGDSNVGKTSYALNLASEFADKKVPVLVLPFERGNEAVGKRFLQVRYNMAEGDFVAVPEQDWKEMKIDCSSLPVYFSKPSLSNVFETIRRSKRLFGTDVIIIDHLDILARNAPNRIEAQGKILQDLKELAIEIGVIMIVVHHIKKINNDDKDDPFKKRTPTKEDLKGSSNLYQDPECVIMLYSTKDGILTVDIQKNKGKMMKKDYEFNVETGRILLEARSSPLKTDITNATHEQRTAVAEELLFG